MARRYKRNLSDIVTYEKEQQAIYRKVLKEVREANRRLEKLERGLKTFTRIKRRGKYKSINVEYENLGSNTWAGGKLKKRLRDYMVNNRVQISSNMNITALRAVSKAINQFKVSLTSTPKGIKQARENVKEAISITFGDDGERLEERETELLSAIFTDSNATDLMKEVDLKGSEYIPIVKDTIRHYRDFRYKKKPENMTIKDLMDPKIKSREEETRDYFIDQLEKYGNYELVKDADVRELAEKFLEKLYDKL